MDEQEPDLIEFSERSRRHVRPMAVASVAVVALAAGAGGAYAATRHTTPSATTSAYAATSSSPSPSASTAPRLPKRGFRVAFGGGLALGLGSGLGSVQHGQVVVRKANGTFETLDIQIGTVTAVSSTSITLKSADGYAATYAVNSSTIVDAQSAGIGSVKTGDRVFVTATVSGSTATAFSVTDATAVKAGRAHFGFPMKPATPPTPSTSTS